MRADRPACEDSGFATVWVVAAIALVVAATAVAGGYSVATLERHRAAAAADASALMVALDAVRGPGLACSDAALLARRNGASVTDCVLQGSVAQVAVRVQLPGLLAGFGPAIGVARAGPASLG
ncbi:MAG TPA: Rv3654c family TadE-like protein [Mycobacteriales bacterium]|jgi:secretion/DNA translocation related TadE-like protein|nr:Rv3654c family TadE-like protein [Mycobacteriales bacterium]